MATALPVAPAIRFHLSLNVSDLNRSVAFFRTLFGMEPAKLRADYAKFEPDDPPLVLSLEPAKEVTRSNVEDGDRAEQQHVYKDSSVSGKDTPLKVGGKPYPKGLALRPYTELVYDLRGEYREFSAVVGFRSV